MELFILLCMIFGIMAPIFVPIVGGAIWGLFELCKLIFPALTVVGVLYLVLDGIRTSKIKGRGKLLYERAQLEKERDKLLKEKETRHE